MNRMQTKKEKWFRSPASMKKLKDAIEQFKIYNNGVINDEHIQSLNYFSDKLTLEDTRNREISASKDEVNQYIRSQRNGN